MLAARTRTAAAARGARQQAVCSPASLRVRRAAAGQPICQPAAASALAAAPVPSSSGRSLATVVCSAASAPSAGLNTDRKLISRTEVPAFIQRDDMMDQMLRWAYIEAGESGIRNFGMPMTVEPFYMGTDDKTKVLWGYTVGIFKEGVKLTEVVISFDADMTTKHEWVGRGDDGFPILEGKVEEVQGKNFEIWKNDSIPVTEELRSTIRAFCTGLVAAVNRYYSFGSVFVDDAQ